MGRSDPAAHGARLRELGAAEVIADPSELRSPVDGVLDLVGGRHLVESYRNLSEGGTLVAVGHAAGQDEIFPYGALFGDQGRHDRSVVTFFLLSCPNLAPDLNWLSAQVAAGALDPNIFWRGDWAEIDEAAEALRTRRLHGKAVLEVR
ncbi:zinc-binding dehydrogenase [Nocardia sp. IFM 10818]